MRVRDGARVRSFVASGAIFPASRLARQRGLLYRTEMTAARTPIEAIPELAADVRRSLLATPKQLPSKYLYDALGSHLFEAICQLPWYRITRAESALLNRFAGALVAGLEDPVSMVELGSGSGEKLAVLGEALRGRGDEVLVHLIDISRTALELSERTLGRLPHLRVICHEATYEAGLMRAAKLRPASGTMLVLFLGSNIGNLDAAAAHEFLAAIRRALRPGDALLLGADLVKPEPEMMLAYDDPLGVTAAFNKNLLVRINRELGGRFELGSFRHRARWDAAASRMEMHLVSTRRQVAAIDGAGLEVRFEEGETIWTESSYKYTAEGVVEMGARAGFGCAEQWVDPEAQFSLTLFHVGRGSLRAVPSPGARMRALRR
jgi:L-histidine Nalpha-methyltransferase